MNMPEDKQETAAKPEKNGKSSFGAELYSLLHDLVYIVAVVTIVFVFCVRVIGVKGPSMTPTLLEGDYLLLESNFLYRDIEAGDVVVLQKESYDVQPIVKRVIATEGQTVDIDFQNGIVYVDGVALEEDYINEPTYVSYENIGEGMDYPITLGEGELFVLGDNRNNSADSRYAPIGIIDEREVLGKVLVKIWPFSRIGAIGK